jgi:hypothetical protein
VPVLPTAALQAQGGLVRHDQLDALGVTAAMLRHRLGTGRWRQVLPSVYATFDHYLTANQRWAAACLYAGPGAMLTGRVALQVYGVRNLPADPYTRVLVPHARQVPSADVVRVHRTRRPDPHARSVEITRICSPVRAAMDATRWCRDLRAIRALLGEVLETGLVSEGGLAAELRHGPTAGSALPRLALRDLTGERPDRRAT